MRGAPWMVVFVVLLCAGCATGRQPAATDPDPVPAAASISGGDPGTAARTSDGTGAFAGETSAAAADGTAADAAPETDTDTDADSDDDDMELDEAEADEAVIEAKPDLPSTDLPGRLELHRPNYIMPVTWTDRANGRSDAELKFQISLRHRIGDFPVYFGYTQVAYLRWLDEENSRPFREINFNPEIWYRVRPGRLWAGEALDWLGLDLGYEHESNGEDLPQSRSWDRLYARPFFDSGPWHGALKVWYRIPESKKDSPTDPSGDDNPEILDYYGYHELNVNYTFTDGDWLSVTTRYAAANRRGSLRLEYATPTPTRNSYFFFQLFSGYGESLQTFKENRSRIGFGFALLR